MKIFRVISIIILTIFALNTELFAQSVFPVKITLEQKTLRKLSAFKERVAIGLGDITAGQVPVRIEDVENNKSLLDSISVKLYEHMSFQYEGKKYYLQIVALRNFPLGSDDNADILVTDQEKDFVAIPVKPTPIEK